MTKLQFLPLPDGVQLSLRPGMHFAYGEFFPPCMKFMTPAEYVGVMFSMTYIKADVTCQECKEWLHA